MLGVDRTNDKVAGLYQMEHPAIIRSVRRVYKAARSRSCGLSICGNLTENFGMLYYFVGLGIDRYSLNSVQLPRVQGFLRRIDSRKAAADVEKIIPMKTTREIREFLAGKIREALQQPEP
jgi:phosphoenolpyruvate-protein kinase (PTS system EI component)